MHDGGWEALLRHIPVEQHNKYMVVTGAGTEIAVQNLLRIDKEMVVIRGRLSGTQDQGRVFFIPYKSIDYLGTSQEIKEAEFEATYASFEFPVAEPMEYTLAAAPEPEPEPEPEPVPVAPPNGMPRLPTTASGVRRLRSDVLEKFRNGRPGGPTSSISLPRPGS